MSTTEQPKTAPDPGRLPFKVLTVDGGGIKGLYSALLLAYLEEEYGAPIADHFDLLSGTSTGGLIALGLSLKIPAREIAEFYQSKASLIFPSQAWRLGPLRKTVWGGKYKQAELRGALEERFGDHVLADSKTLLCIPSYALTAGRPWIFKYDHAGLRGRDNQTRYVDVALATSAAPTFFPVVAMGEHVGERFIDGGVYANNPVVIAVTEAFSYFVGEGRQYDRVEVLSVPSVEVPTGQKPSTKTALSLLGWGGKLIDPFMTGQSHIAHFVMKQFDKHSLLPVTYHRMRSPEVSPMHSKLIHLDRADKKAVQLLTRLGEDEGRVQRRDAAVSPFFETFKTYITNP